MQHIYYYPFTAKSKGRVIVQTAGIFVWFIEAPKLLLLMNEVSIIRYNRQGDKGLYKF